MILPDAVHNGARGQRIARIGDPLRKAEPAAGQILRQNKWILLRALDRETDRAEHAGPHLLARRLQRAAHEDVRRPDASWR